MQHAAINCGRRHCLHIGMAVAELGMTVQIIIAACGNNIFYIHTYFINMPLRELDVLYGKVLHNGRIMRHKQVQLRHPSVGQSLPGDRNLPE